ncbi:nucleoporin NUP100/NSP100-like [Contarinia nasturtii]|uniref:nucleoporin NUP100/NSP100-like n=1 Tax=Contarinia nasturtii TaxID=265458 RepID=UPI0012D49AFE|nr:nucleoporin NUP100/NSP100-like [Contarinia nasturtii]
MVICSYFLNNTCRFGTKCHNEHVNVKLTLKTDAEGALKGNQWPLSSYGPFRDKPCIPNFIEDQTFEEIRHLCYEAKATGNVQMVTNQFTQNILDAKNKMNMLTNPTEDVVGMVTNLYNSTCTTTPAAQNQTNTANPFGVASNTMNSGGGIFGSSGGNAAPTNNLFGSSTATSSNPFARNAAGFGSAQPQTTNLFGGSSTTTNSMNLFGGNSATSMGGATSGGSLFGGSSFNTNNAQSTTFATNAGANQSTSLFGSSAAPAPFGQQNPNASPFGLASTNQQTSTGGLFGAQANPVFGGGANFGNQVKQPGLFGQASLGQPQNTGNIFGQNANTAPAFGAPAPQQTNLFGNTAQNQTTSLFGGSGGQQQTMQSDNPFAAVAQSATTNIFSQSQMQQQPQQASPFQSTNNTFGGNSSAFGQNANVGQSLFNGGMSQANTNQMNAPPTAQASAQSLQQQQQSIFGANSYAAQPQAQPFGGGGNQFFQNAQEQKPSTQPLFGAQTQPQGQQNPFGAPAPVIQQSKTLYTPMDSLSQEEIEAFNSTSFDIKRIPTKPPPMELCI